MNEVIHEFQVQHLYLCTFVIFICFATILIAMTIDLVAGIQKAKELHVARTSTGLKKTCDKAKKYFSTFLTAALMDVATCIISPFPIFSIVWTVYLLSCEFKSIREKAYEKAEIRKQDRTMQVILENKDEIAKAVVEIMKEERKKGGDNEDN
nr:MAG TPA: holin [Caudoviricetes sp.]